MNIDNWPLDRIMRLPDWCFGRRWWTGTYTGTTNGGSEFWICEENLPDKFVVWGVMFSFRTPNGTNMMRVSIRLGDRLPANLDEFRTKERVFKNVSVPNIVYEFYVPSNDIRWIPAERQLIESAGRRMVMLTNGDGVNTHEGTVALLISAMPKEVPDWLISGRDKSLL